ncbi:hydrogenase maturation protein HypF [Hydrogenophaga crassostreae]|uniref:Hydrogenase maturation protein HypF n=2 Tax=Hydrogenophaga crassostreae TaxID=1763535 RepID=A0A167IQH2_9BURK|nr:hydrogenase maturation protein HypF [Hydrogenophaga crassostreae]OAD43357.1 hydrogenase maturation protein HypF [Hydrogenophaga crassostreae]
MPRAALPTVLAVGAWLKNTACLLVAGEPRWSAVHGDLSDPAACTGLEASVCQLLAMHGRSIAAVAHDLHPDFFSTQLAVEFAAKLGVPAIGVQHHHAHIAAVVAEHGIEGPVIGLALDGVGLGTDGAAWGGELLWVQGSQWARLGHLQPLALPGGDRAAREPWRMAASALHVLGRGEEISCRFAPTVGASMAGGVQQMLERGLNCPFTSSTGRWFDAAAGALGLCLHQTDEAQAAIALESGAQRWLAQHQHPKTDPLPGASVDAHNRLVLGGLLAHLFDLPEAHRDQAAAGFHLALADALADWAIRAATSRGSRTVCLGGGCFFNRILCERVTARLQAAGLAVFRPIDKGCGDAGLALGQAWVAAQQLVTHPRQDSPEKEIEPCV